MRPPPPFADSGLSTDEAGQRMWTRMSAGDKDGNGILSEKEFIEFLPAVPEAPAGSPGGVPGGRRQVGPGAPRPEATKDQPPPHQDGPPGQ